MVVGLPFLPFIPAYPVIFAWTFLLALTTGSHLQKEIQRREVLVSPKQDIVAAIFYGLLCPLSVFGTGALWNENTAWIDTWLRALWLDFAIECLLGVYSIVSRRRIMQARLRDPSIRLDDWTIRKAAIMSFFIVQSTQLYYFAAVHRWRDSLGAGP